MDTHENRCNRFMLRVTLRFKWIHLMKSILAGGNSKWLSLSNAEAILAGSVLHFYCMPFSYIKSNSRVSCVVLHAARSYGRRRGKTCECVLFSSV